MWNKQKNRHLKASLSTNKPKWFSLYTPNKPINSTNIIARNVILSNKNMLWLAVTWTIFYYNGYNVNNFNSFALFMVFDNIYYSNRFGTIDAFTIFGK